MRHAFMASLACASDGRGIATLRFPFPFMEDADHDPQEPTREILEGCHGG